MTPTCEKTLAVIAMVEGDISPEEPRELEAHLAECPHCRAAIDELHALDATLSCVAAAPARADVWSSLEARLEPSRPAGIWLTLIGIGLVGWRAFEMAAVDLQLWASFAPLGLALVLFIALRVNPFRVEPRLI